MLLLFSINLNLFNLDDYDSFNLIRKYILNTFLILLDPIYSFIKNIAFPYEY
jgi:hypothetical protein